MTSQYFNSGEAETWRRGVLRQLAELQLQQVESILDGMIDSVPKGLEHEKQQRWILTNPVREILTQIKSWKANLPCGLYERVEHKYNLLHAALVAQQAPDSEGPRIT